MGTETKQRRVLSGTVVSNKMSKTVVVRVERKFVHSRFKKVVRRSKRFKAHDENNECQIGDFISICETRPLSKDKRWRLLEVINKATVIEAAK